MSRLLHLSKHAQLVLTLVMACALLVPAKSARGAGVAAFKQQAFHGDDTAVPIIFSEIRETATSVQIDVGAKTTAYEKHNIAGYVLVPALPESLQTGPLAESLRKSVEEMGSFARKYKKTASILDPYLEQFGKVFARLDAGEVRIRGQWVTKDAYAQMQAKIAQDREAMRLAEEKKQKEMAAARAKQEAFAAEQRAKGLEEYKGQWLPKDKADALNKRDQELVIAWNKVQAKSIRNLKYSVFQVIQNGMLIEPIAGTIIQGGLNVDLVCLYGVAKGTAAEGDLYKDDVFWCGTYTYSTRGGKTSTVHAYSLDRDDAISRVHKTLFAGGEESPPEDGKPTARPVASSEPLRDAVSTGSGFFVGTEGYFVTNAHVVGDASKAEIIFADKVLQAKVINVSKAVDLAVLKTSEKVTGIELGQENPDLGLDVYAIGFPNPDLQGTEVKVTKGVISSRKGFNNDDTRFQIDAAIQPGNSGGPLCDASGKLVGVIVSALNAVYVAKETGSIPQNVNYAIKTSEVAVFLRSRSITTDVKPAAGSGDAPPSALRHAIASTGLVVIKN